MAHTHEEVLGLAQQAYPGQAADVVQVHPEDDVEWWVTDSDHDTFALAWFDEGGTFQTKPYKP